MGDLTVTDTAALRRALELVEAATGPLDKAAAEAIADLAWPIDTADGGLVWADTIRALQYGDLNAVVSLIEREMPGWRKQLFKDFDENGKSRWTARVISPRHHLYSNDEDEQKPEDPALAFLVALFRAKIAEAEQRETADV